MNSQLFNSIGLGDLDAAYLFITLAALLLLFIILSIVQSVQIKKLKKKYMKFMQGKDAKNLEDKIYNLLEDNRYLRAAIEKNKKDIQDLDIRLGGTFQKIGLVKYDAFNQMGGKLSFSLALLDGHDDGFILNSVHSSDGCYSYTKEIKKGKSAIALGDEEQQALTQAMGV